MTRYIAEIECADLGEFDDKVLADLGIHAAHVMHDADVGVYTLTLRRERDDYSTTPKASPPSAPSSHGASSFIYQP